MTERQPTTIVAVRHGETEWNVTGRQQGHLDSPLTESGVKQATALACGLHARSIDRIYSSDLGRALRTAEIIGDTIGSGVDSDVRLRERHLGVMQGMTKVEFRERYPEEWVAFRSNDPDYCFPNGESARQRYARSVACIEEIAGLHPGERVLVVTHGGILNGLFYKAVGLSLSEPRQFSLLNAAINQVSVHSGKWNLDVWGDVSHLDGMATRDDN